MSSILPFSTTTSSHNSFLSSPLEQTANFHSEHYEEALISEKVIQEIASRILRFQSPKSDVVDYYPPSSKALPRSAKSAHILFFGGTRFKALFPGDLLKEESFRTIQKGLLYDSESKTTKNIEISTLKEDYSNSCFIQWNHNQSVLMKIMKLIKESKVENSVFITPPLFSFADLWIDQPHLCNIQEALLGKHPDGMQPSLQEFLGMIKDMTKTLEWLHNKGIIHGAVTPQNMVFLRNDTNTKNLTRVYLGKFDHSTKQGFFRREHFYEDPCSNLKISTRLTDVFGFACTLAILFSNPKNPLTLDILKQECQKQMSEYRETGKINTSTPPKYPFEKAIRLICYAQLRILFSIFKSNYKTTGNYSSLSEYLSSNPLYQSFFTPEAILQSEKQVAEEFKKEGIQFINLSDLLNAAESLIKQKEEEIKKIKESSLSSVKDKDIIFPLRKEQSSENDSKSKILDTTPQTLVTKQTPSQYFSDKEIEEAHKLLFPAYYERISLTQPSTANANKNPSLASRNVSMPANQGCGVSSSNIETLHSQQNPLNQNFRLARPPSNTETTAYSEENSAQAHSGSPPRSRRKDTPISNNSQSLPSNLGNSFVRPSRQPPSIVQSSTYGAFTSPSSLNSSKTLSLARRDNTPIPGTNNRSLPQANFTPSSTHGLIKK